MNILSGIPLVNTLVKTIFGDKVARDKQSHTGQMAVYNQFASEFGHDKTWFDSLINGINRLPRPTITFGVIYIFYYCITDPKGFEESMIALSAMPKEGWWILGIIITFWFGTQAMKYLPKDFGKIKRIAPKVIKKVGKQEKEWSERVTKRYSNYNE